MQHGSQLDPPNPYEKTHIEADLEQVEWDTEYLKERTDRKVQYLADDAQSIVSENDSPDIPFRYSVNLYRGCVHGCAYCYARPSHEFLGFNAGLDFETRILVKHAAPTLLKRFLSGSAWQAEPITFCGVTDAYQPAERTFRLTRQCLEIVNDCNQPISIITKNALILRDLDLLQDMASRSLVHANLSITTLDPHIARVMEPRTSIPAARLRAIETLAGRGIPVRVMVAPIIPGLTDHELSPILQAARDAGAQDADYALLRLPLTVEPVFREWLSRTQPLTSGKVEQCIRQTRQGKMNESTWGQRMTGTGQVANQIKAMFHVFHAKLGFDGLPELDRSQFRPPNEGGQLRLF